MSNASVALDVFAFLGNHISVPSDGNGRILLPLILVAKLALYAKRTVEKCDLPIPTGICAGRYRHLVNGNLRSDRGAFRAESLC